MRVRRLNPRLTQQTSLTFLRELVPAFRFRSLKFSATPALNSAGVSLGVEAGGMKYRYIRPRRPQQNGKVEWSHRIDSEEFWNRHSSRRVLQRRRLRKGETHRSYRGADLTTLYSRVS
jgi:hypothetical protein